MTARRTPVAVAREVARALRTGRPVVALETSLVSHGFPPGLGLATALEMDGEVRAAGALPAFVGVGAGRLHVGLSRAALERLASEPGVPKVSLGNLGAALAAGQLGSTTVAATLVAASAAGVRVFATGGIGGVHRGAVESGDVSADLPALARFAVAVVCSGAKAVLDLPQTVERLETLGVPLFGFGSDRFPAFYRRDSGLAVDARFDSVEALARAVRAHLRLGLGSGLVVANPIPVDHELPAHTIEPALSRALADAGAAGLRGREVTPFLLERLRLATGDRSVAANRALLRSNARLAGDLAVALARRR